MVFAPCNIMEGNSATITVTERTFTLNPTGGQACFISATSVCKELKRADFTLLKGWTY